MTEDEFIALKVGDEVYTVDRNAYNANATGDRRMTRRTVTKVNKTTVATSQGYGNRKAPDLLTIEAGDAALAGFLRLKAERDALAGRWADVRTRLRIALGGTADDRAVHVPSHGNYININSTRIDDAERLAAALEIGAIALRLHGDLRSLLTDDSPTVHMHLSTAQAKRVLAALEAAPQ